jgi:CPA2 family monovalent cation:H+ antiporter-2
VSHDFFFQAFVYLAAAVVSVPIAKRLGMGAVLGYLVAGVAIGPFGLALLGTDSQDILHFAEFGVVMMLFVVGLELEPSRLWRLRGALLGLGGLQVLGTAIAIGVAAIVLGVAWKPALAAGFILAMSSTAIVLQSLTEKGLLKTEAGERSFAVLLFQDIAVIPLLALLPLLASVAAAPTGAEHGSAWIETLPAWSRALATLGAVASIVAGGRWLVRPVFGAIARTRLQELFTAAALLLVVGITLLMTQVGLSPALGTFVAGVVLANSEYRHELETDIEPFKGLLLGLFFIAVGASIDFGLVETRIGLVSGLVVGLVVVKFLVLLALGRIFRMRLDQDLLFALALAQGGEFCFVLLSFSVQNGILDGTTANVLVATVALSMVTTPLLLLLHEKVLQPLFTAPARPTREADKIDQYGVVILAGFGAFGTIVGRLLVANRIPTTVLDFDPDNVDLLNRIGLKVFYGDASRLDLLRAAGAESAQMMVLAIGDRAKSLEIVETVKRNFPKLTILARAHSRQEAYDLLNAGVEHVYRESLDSSLHMGVDALRMLGMRATQANHAARTFRRHDERNVREQAFIHDDKEFLDSAAKAIHSLEDLLLNELDGQTNVGDSAWDSASRRREFGRGE